MMMHTAVYSDDIRGHIRIILDTYANYTQMLLLSLATALPSVARLCFACCKASVINLLPYLLVH